MLELIETGKITLNAIKVNVVSNSILKLLANHTHRKMMCKAKIILFLLVTLGTEKNKAPIQQETEDCLVHNYSKHPISSYVRAFHGRGFEEVRIP